MQILDQLIQNSVLYIPRLIGSIAILIIGLKIQHVFIVGLSKLFEKHMHDPTLEKFVQSLFKIGYKILILLLAISVAGIETTSFIAMLGAAGFAVGLALQGSMSNFASGILILSLKPIRVGDYVDVVTFSGTVHKIDIFNTLLLTPDNKTIIIPNSEITSKVLINYSRRNIRRIDIKINVSYTADLKKAKQIITKSVNKYSEKILEDEEKSTVIAIGELTETAVVISVLVWCESKDYLSLKRELLENIVTALNEAKITMPVLPLQAGKKSA